MEEKKELLTNIKHTYQLLFHPDKIKIKESLSEKQKEQARKDIYKDKLKLHEKLGAKQFQKLLIKLDKYKFKFLKKVIKEERVLKYSDQYTDKETSKQLKKAKTQTEKEMIKEIARRKKVLTRCQLKEEKSINYFVNVDRRSELFPFYLEYNKKIHKRCLKTNGILLASSIIMGISGIAILPIMLGGYQVLAGIKNIQCINIQEYNLARIKVMQDIIIKRNMRSMKKKKEENKELIKEIKPIKEKGKDIYQENDIVDFINTKEGLLQLRQNLLALKKTTHFQEENNISKEPEEMLIPKVEERIKPVIAVKK